MPIKMLLWTIQGNQPAIQTIENQNKIPEHFQKRNS